MSEVLYEGRKFEIQPATLEDVVGIGEAHFQSWLETYPNEEYGVTEDWVRDEFTYIKEDGQREDGSDKGITFRRKLLSSPDPDRLYEVVKDDAGQVQGFMHVTKNQSETSLNAIYLTADLLGTGVAQELMGHAIAFAEDQPMELGVAAYNERAIRFYEKYGFVRGEIDPGYFHGKIPIMGMRRDEG